MFSFDDMRRIQSAADLQLFAQGAEGDVILTTEPYQHGNPHIDIYAGAKTRWTIDTNELLACIVLHPDGTWTRKKFPPKPATRDDGMPF